MYFKNHIFVIVIPSHPKLQTCNEWCKCNHFCDLNIVLRNINEAGCCYCFVLT